MLPAEAKRQGVVYESFLYLCLQLETEKSILLNHEKHHSHIIRHFSIYIMFLPKTKWSVL